MKEKEYILYSPDKIKDVWMRRYWLIFCFLFFVISIIFIIWFYFTNIPEVLIHSPNVPDMPVASDTFDCDDSALFMHEYFTSNGYECTIVVGNLEIENETFYECKHVWVVVTSHDKKTIAYDWGIPQFDKQHYHGFELTPDQLKEIVESELLKLERATE